MQKGQVYVQGDWFEGCKLERIGQLDHQRMLVKVIGDWGSGSKCKRPD